MKQDIIICGVGGQGTLSIATVIGEAAVAAGLNIKQAEVHGMSQRGGDVQSHLRLSDEPIYADLIKAGEVDMILAMEPMEALRYVQYLSKDGWIVTSSKPFINIPDYPDQQKLMAELASFPHVVSQDIEALASEMGYPRSSNMVLLGMAASLLKVLSPEQLRSAIDTVFKSKGEGLAETNTAAFDAGLNAK
ncbi:MAG: indolepyruvate oxidoreductase subunit beta [Bacteroidales bacterium]|nr:indolepyruvate oxidoreductase subunit beta [Candidatus Cacconaster merdequi]